MCTGLIYQTCLTFFIKKNKHTSLALQIVKSLHLLALSFLKKKYYNKIVFNWNNYNCILKNIRSKPTFQIYHMLLMLMLIIILWIFIYQPHMNNCCFFNIFYKYLMRIKYLFFIMKFIYKFLKLIIPIFSHTLHKIYQSITFFIFYWNFLLKSWYFLIKNILRIKNIFFCIKRNIYIKKFVLAWKNFD
jgi:hypothetical protein